MNKTHQRRFVTPNRKNSLCTSIHFFHFHWNCSAVDKVVVTNSINYSQNAASFPVVCDGGVAALFKGAIMKGAKCRMHDLCMIS